MSISSSEGSLVSMDHAGLLGTSVLTHGIVSRIDAPKGKSPEFYEGLAYALSTMEDQA